MKIFKHGVHIIFMEKVCYTHINEREGEVKSVEIFTVESDNPVVLRDEAATAFLEYIDALAEDK